MKRAYWRLKYARDVVTKLYELRERGFAAHAGIKAFEVPPLPGSTPTSWRCPPWGLRTT